MKINDLILKLFLRLAISTGLLSAVADRFGCWSEKYTAWGNWESFIHYTAKLNPWFFEAMIPLLAITATALEIIFAIFILVGFKTELMAKLTGFLLLIFALSMTFSGGIKTAFDASVFMASGAAFALGSMKRVKLLELDRLFMEKF